MLPSIVSAVKSYNEKHYGSTSGGGSAGGLFAVPCSQLGVRLVEGVPGLLALEAIEPDRDLPSSRSVGGGGFGLAKRKSSKARRKEKDRMGKKAGGKTEPSLKKGEEGNNKRKATTAIGGGKRGEETIPQAKAPIINNSKVEGESRYRDVTGEQKKKRRF